MNYIKLMFRYYPYSPTIVKPIDWLMDWSIDWFYLLCRCGWIHPKYILCHIEHSWKVWNDDVIRNHLLLVCWDLSHKSKKQSDGTQLHCIKTRTNPGTIYCWHRKYSIMCSFPWWWLMMAGFSWSTYYCHDGVGNRMVLRWFTGFHVAIRRFLVGGQST